ncbi:glycine--tRNA ligase subunit beta, partial [Pseudomonas aeruginosa]
RIGGNAQHASRAGILSKCARATEMVGEFPEMQGIAGYYYATHGGEAEDVAVALNEQYMPRGAGAARHVLLVEGQGDVFRFAAVGGVVVAG